MRRAGSWLVVAAVSLLAAASALDSLHSQTSAERPRVPPRREPAPEPAFRDLLPVARRAAVGRAAVDVEPAALPRELAKAGVSGRLVFADPRCSIHTVELPRLVPAAPVVATRCGLYRRPRATGCREGVLAVAADGGAPLYEVASCAGKPSGARARLTASDIRAALRFHPSTSPVLDPRINDVAWLTDTRLAVIVDVASRSQPDAELLVVYEGRAPVGADLSSFGGFLDLHASPQGTYLATRTERRDSQLLLYDNRARALRLPAWFPYVRDVAWSPDEKWMAVATRSSVYLLRAGKPNAHLFRLPLVAADVAWVDD